MMLPRMIFICLAMLAPLSHPHLPHHGPPRVKQQAHVVREVRVPSGPFLSGRTTWYGARGMIGAAGPGLRRWLGPGWRGESVVVRTASGRQVTVKLTDWCACKGSRIIDLSDDAFARLAPLSSGVLSVKVSKP